MAAAAGRGHAHFRASHADREQVIDTLKTAFVHGRLTRDELDARTGRALAARTYADLAALTADIPPAPAAAGLARPPAPARRRPLSGRPVAVGICLIITAAAIGGAWLIPDPDGSSPWSGLMVLLAVSGLWTALGILGYAVFTAWEDRSSRRQLPPRPGQGGPAPEVQRPGHVAHDPALARDHPDQARAYLRTDSSRPGRPCSSRGGARIPRRVGPVPGAV